MNQRVKQICDEIRQLTTAEQAELMAELGDIMGVAHDPAIGLAWLEEAERRLLAIDRGTLEIVSASGAVEELRKRFPRTT